MSLHINAEAGKIAPVVLMPGDPLRAKFMAERFLEDVQQVASTRNMYYFTGNYKGKRISYWRKRNGVSIYWYLLL